MGKLDDALAGWMSDLSTKREKLAFIDGFAAATKKNPPETAPKDRRILAQAESGEFYCVHWVKHPVTGDEAWLLCDIDDENQALLKSITCRYELPPAN
ncbi:hypothetical protein R2083_08200 [Nitrosomonas sp. Is35]|uniref:hypothetical protein n=1 Tax=Nitrosomonas sp. Is35 TaxID=3080534 RepID=UPI00294B778A|nr:hypothetical protein [Nitrosomonas sp. Is35]MDV6347495.1 hypothetical protein [Nitrosomonas sp. Is35]